MRKKNPDEVTNKQFDVKQVSGVNFFFQPTLDQNFLTKSPLELLESGEFQKKSILLGVNSHEGAYFAFYAFPKRFDPTKPYNDSITGDDYREMVKQLRLANFFADSPSDEVTDTIAAAYSLPCGSEGNTGDSDALPYIMSLDGMFGDVWFKCPVVHMAKTYAKEVIPRLLFIHC